MACPPMCESSCSSHLHLQVCLRKRECPYVWLEPCTNQQDGNAKKQASESEASVANWNLRPFVLVKWWNDYNWKKVMCISSEWMYKKWQACNLMITSQHSGLPSSLTRGVQPHSRESRMPSPPIHECSHRSHGNNPEVISLVLRRNHT